jgi:hypothetical protein
MKLNCTRFIKQWVTLELYNELFVEIFSTRVTPLNGDKDCLDFQCVYCGGEVSCDFLTIGLKGAQML